MKINKKAVGQRIKSIRQKKGMTLEEFGNLFNASKGNVKGWEDGKNTPNPERLTEIAKVGNMTVDELLHGTEKELVSIAYNALSTGLEINPKDKEEIINYTLETIGIIGFEALSYEDIEQFTQSAIFERFPELRNTSKSFINDENTLVSKIIQDNIDLETRLKERLKDDATPLDVAHFTQRIEENERLLTYLELGLNKVVVYNNTLYITALPLDALTPVDIDVPLFLVDKIKVVKINGGKVKTLLETTVKSKDHILSVIKQYHDYNTNISLMYID